MQINIGNFLLKRAKLSPGKEALVDTASGVRLTYSQSNENVNRTANALRRLGIKAGDRVAVLLHNGSRYIELFFAAAKIGAVVVPLNWRLSPEELAFILSDSGSSTILCDPAFQQLVVDVLSIPTTKRIIQNVLVTGVEESRPEGSRNLDQLACEEVSSEPPIECFDEAPLFIMYTSGTTGNPKGVLHTHRSVWWAIDSMSITWDLARNDRFLVALPLFHVGALTPAIMSIYFGMTSIITRGFNATEYWKILKSENVTNSLMVPTMLTLMLEAKPCATPELPNLRWFAVSGAPVPTDLLSRYAAMGIELQQLYGLTEACGPGCQLTGSDVGAKPGSAGKPFFHNEVKIVGVDGVEVPVAERGELLIRAPHLMSRYWNLPQATSETIKDGWFHTGDIATMDGEGFIYIVDRLKDMIISGGENIYPAEIEKVIAGIPGVLGVAVIGIPDKKWGESPHAIIESSDPSLNAEDIIAYCGKHLAKYKIPSKVSFVESLPRTSSGKVKKVQLKNGSLGSSSVA